MFYLRLIALLALVSCLPMAQGCQNCGVKTGPAAPPPSFCYFQRFGTEMGWLFADVNDLLFGINYYPYMESKYGAGPYAQPQDDSE